MEEKLRWLDKLLMSDATLGYEHFSPVSLVVRGERIRVWRRSGRITMDMIPQKPWVNFWNTLPTIFSIESPPRTVPADTSTPSSVP